MLRSCKTVLAAVVGVFFGGCDTDSVEHCDRRGAIEIGWAESVESGEVSSPSPADVLSRGDELMAGAHDLTWNPDYVAVAQRNASLMLDIEKDESRSPQHAETCNGQVEVPVYLSFETSDELLRERWSTRLIQEYSIVHGGDLQLLKMEVPIDSSSINGALELDDEVPNDLLLTIEAYSDPMYGIIEAQTECMSSDSAGCSDKMLRIATINTPPWD